MDINVRFCRLLLAALVEEFRAEFPKVRTNKHAWVYHFGRSDWEFQGAKDGPAAGFYWSGKADNAYDARYKGWTAWRNEQKRKEESENGN